MVENFDEANFDRWVLAFAGGLKSAQELEEYADSLKIDQVEREAAQLFFLALDHGMHGYKAPLQVRERASKAITIIRERFFQP